MTGVPLHLFLTGEIQVGKSTIVSSVVSRLGVPVSGFRTVFCPAGVFCFFRCLLSTVYCLLSSLAGGPEPVQRCGFLVVWCFFLFFWCPGRLFSRGRF